MSESDMYSAQIVLCVGDAGTGKTFYAMNHYLRTNGFFLDLEHRYTETLKHHPEIDLLEITEHVIDKTAVYGVYRNKWDGKTLSWELVEKLPAGKVVPNSYCNCLVYDKDYNVDRSKSYERLQTMVNNAIKCGIRLIVVDGIEDVRRMAMEKYEEDTKKNAYGFQAWGIINDMVKRLLFRIFNYARLNDTKVVLTTHFQRVYTPNGEPTAEVEINAKDYITDRVDEILAFKRTGTDFYYKRGKSPKGPSDLIEWRLEEDTSND